MVLCLYLSLQSALLIIVNIIYAQFMLFKWSFHILWKVKTCDCGFLGNNLNAFLLHWLALSFEICVQNFYSLNSNSNANSLHIPFRTERIPRFKHLLKAENEFEQFYSILCKKLLCLLSILEDKNGSGFSGFFPACIRKAG